MRRIFKGLDTSILELLTKKKQLNMKLTAKQITKELKKSKPNLKDVEKLDVTKELLKLGKSGKIQRLKAHQEIRYYIK